MDRRRTPLIVWAIALVGILTSGCKKDQTTNPQDELALVGTTWGLSSLQGAPGPVDESNSVWNFRSNGTYDWFLLYEPYFDLRGQGTYRFEGDLLHLTGIFRETVIENLEGDSISISGTATQFRFRDDEGDEWEYSRIPDPDLNFIEQPSYSGNCQERPSGTVCLRFSDGYIWLITDSVGGGNNQYRYYLHGEPIQSVDGERAIYHHVLHANLVAIEPKSR
jgi:hypothetical protein